MLANQNAIESGGYVIQNSLRFSAASSNYLSRTFVTPTNDKIWTWSAWVKRGALANGTLFTGDPNTSGSNIGIIDFVNNSIRVFQDNSAVPTLNASTTSLLRDPSAWYHIVVSFNTTHETSLDRLKIYVNGIRQTLSYSTGPLVQNTASQINSAKVHNIGRLIYANTSYFDGYLSENHFIDGQELTPSSFGETNIETGEWVAKPYTGTYGTNGFYLDFSDGTSTTTLGYDAAGSNDWTLTNFTRSAGVNDCWMEDVPAGNGESSAVQPSGNYCVWNPNDRLGTTTSGANLNAVYNASGFIIRGTLAFPATGKWYYEMTQSGTGDNFIGLSPISATLANLSGASTGFYAYYSGAFKYTSGVATAYGASFGNTDVIGVAVDCDAGTVTFYKNNVSQGVAFTGLDFSLGWLPIARVSGTGVEARANFGQRSFAYTPPTGFKALCTSNLPTPAIKRGDNHFTAKTRTGTGASFSVTGIRHAVGWLFGKSRSAATDWFSYDVNRGAQKQLEFNTTTAETTETTGLTAFNSDGYSGGALAQMNTNGATYIDYLFKAGGAPVSNTAGSITSQVSANTAAGFSVVTYTGTLVAATVGHGLGKVPKMVIVKNISQGAASYHWFVYHDSTGAANRILLNTTGASAADAAAWNNTLPTSNVFSVGTGVQVNENTSSHVAYCFAEIEGFSKFGSYTGNGSADGVFVFTGFKPRWFLVKNASSATDWYIHDTARDTFNPANKELFPNTADAEVAASSVRFFDIVSNGFKVRGDNAGINANGSTYIYWAIAETPINYANAR